MRGPMTGSGGDPYRRVVAMGPRLRGDDSEMEAKLQSETPGRLAENIVYFARALRAAGIPVGPGSVMDALEALSVAGIGSRDDFYWTLHAVFVKRHDHSI